MCKVLIIALLKYCNMMFLTILLIRTNGSRGLSISNSRACAISDSRAEDLKAALNPEWPNLSKEFITQTFSNFGAKVILKTVDNGGGRMKKENP